MICKEYLTLNKRHIATITMDAEHPLLSYTAPAHKTYLRVPDAEHSLLSCTP